MIPITAKGIKPKKRTLIDHAINFAFGTLLLVGVVVGQSTSSPVNHNVYDVDRDVDPCHDFYNYACGNYIRNTIIPNGKDKVTIDTEIDDLIKQKIHEMLMKPSAINEIAPFKKVKKFYQSCMDYHSGVIDMPKINSILEELGRWPILTGLWDEEKFDWMETLFKFRELGIPTNILLPIDVRVNQSNTAISKQYVIHVGVPELLWRTQEALGSFYKNKIINTAVWLGAPQEYAEREIELVIAFERKLAEIKQTLPSPDVFSISDLQTTYPHTDWLTYINGILNMSTQVGNGDLVTVIDPVFVFQFKRLMQTTNKRTIANYMIWRAADFIMSLTPHTNPQMERCVAQAQSMDIATGALYARSYLDEQSQLAAHVVYQAIQNAMLEMIGIQVENHLTNVKVKERLLIRIVTMQLMAGYPNEFLDDAKLENFYHTLQFDSTNYVNLKLELERFRTTLRYEKWQTFTNRTDWTSYIYSKGRIYYSLAQHALVIPAGTMQGRLFDNNTMLANIVYGSLGMEVAIHMLRAFDAVRDDYEELLFGNDQDVLEHETCFIEQYGKYKEPQTGLNVDGRRTLEKNVVDNSALSVVYWANSKLNLSVNDNMQFWTSAAQNWCSKYSPAAIRTIMTSSIYSLDMFRVNGSFSNNEDFSRDFNCSATSRMNPSEKCFLW